MDNSYCCVPQCNSLGSQRPRTSFHRFPREKDEISRRRRREWIRLLRIGKEVSNRMVVCGKHFQPSDFFRRGDGPLARTKLKENALPSLKLPRNSCENRAVSNKKKDNLMRLRRKEMRESASGSINTVLEPKPAFHACCFIPGCVSDCNKTREKNKIDEKINSSSFLLSKDGQLFEKWKRTIPRKDKIPSLKDSVYELHFEEGRFETDSEFDTLQQSNVFLKLSNEVKNMSTPNSWWSVACTEDCIIFAKRNSKCCSERRVVIYKDLSIKTFLMNVEVSLSIEGCTIDNLSQLLQKVDDFIICENADPGTSSGCLGFVVDKKQEFCRTCYKSKKVEKNAERRNAQILVGKKKKSANQVKNINKRITYQRKRVSDLNSEHAESKHQCSKTKEAFLEAISHLPTEQQTAIKSCHSFKTWFL